MRIGREELEELRGKLEQLTEFIRDMEKGELPYFYHCFDTMKNNIEIYFCVGNDDIDDFMPVLERDWNASHGCLSAFRTMTSWKTTPGSIRQSRFISQGFWRGSAGISKAEGNEL